MTVFNGDTLRKHRFLTAKVAVKLWGFTCANSLPSLSVKLIGSVAKATRQIKVVNDRGVVKYGCGLIVDWGTNKQLISVDHVIRHDEVNHITDCATNQPIGILGAIDSLGRSDDPVVKVSMKGADLPAVDIPLLGRGEIKDVKMLLWCHPLGMHTAITDFNFDLERGEIEAHVNLKKGDSGGPVFGIMKDGDMRLCGTVSRGNVREGLANVISCVIGSSREGSPGLGFAESMSFAGSTNPTNRRVIEQIQVQLVNNADGFETYVENGTTKKRKKPTHRTGPIRNAVTTLCDTLTLDELSTSDRNAILNAIERGDVIAFNFQRGVNQSWIHAYQDS